MIYNGFGLILLLTILFINDVNTQSQCFKNLCNQNDTCIMCSYEGIMIPKCFSNTTCYCQDFTHCFLINIYENAWKSLFKLVDFGYILKIDIINPISFTNQIEIVLKNNDSKEDFINKIVKF